MTRSPRPTTSANETKASVQLRQLSAWPADAPTSSMPCSGITARGSTTRPKSAQKLLDFSIGSPFGAAVFSFAGGPAAIFDEAIVRWAGQAFAGDVGQSALGPCGPMVD